jgi:zinc protease
MRFQSRSIWKLTRPLWRGVFACAALQATLTMSSVAAATQAATQSALATPASASTTVNVSQPTHVTTIEGISEYRLANGLRVLLAPDNSKPTTTVNMTYLVGARHEGPGETGMAHLLEHMLFKGTEKTQNALGEFSRRGLRANGTTSADRTNYFASFSANPDTLDWYLGWQADAMVNALIRKEDLDSEMTVVRNEMDRGENDPFRILIQKMRATAYEWHGYGRAAIGARSDVENVDIDQLRNFYKRYYQPDNAVLVVSGAFDPERVLAVINQSFAPIIRPNHALPVLYTVEPVQDGERVVTLRRNGGVPLAANLYHIPAAGAPDYPAVEVATLILSDTPSGRLYKALVEKGLANTTFGFAQAQFDPGMVVLGAQLNDNADINATQKVINDTLENISKEPFTEVELKRAQNNWLNGWKLDYADPEKLGVSLTEAIAAGDWRLYFKMRDRVRDLKLADVRQAAERYLLRSNRTIGHYIPTEKPVRAPALQAVDLSAVLKDYTGDVDFKTAEAFDPSPANLDARTRRETLTLPGKQGRVELALLNKPTRGDRVHAILTLQAGDLKTLTNRSAVAETIGPMLLRGTRLLTRAQLQDRFVELNAQIAMQSTADGNLEVIIGTTGENLPAVLTVVTDVLREASFPAQQLKELKHEIASVIIENRSEPQALAYQALARHNNPWPKEDPRYQPTFDETLARLTALKQSDFVAYRDRFIGVGRVQFSAVGAFDAHATTDALIQGLAKLPQAQAYTRIAQPYRDVPAQRFDIATPDKANAFYVARQWFALADDHPDYPALSLANFLLGQSQKSRLWLRVREQEGLSYDVRSQLATSSYEQQASWTLYAIYAPGDREKLERVINEELKRVLKDGFSDEEVAEARQGLLNYRSLSRAQDAGVAATWQNYLQLARTFKYSAEINAKLAALTTDQVNAALRKYLKPADFTQAAAGDFSATQAAGSARQNDQAASAPAKALP